MKTYRLNRRGSSNYALFIINGESVTFRQFRFYTGPIDKEETMTLEEGRKLYKEMIEKKIQFLPHDNRLVNEWIPVKFKKQNQVSAS